MLTSRHNFSEAEEIFFSKLFEQSREGEFALGPNTLTLLTSSGLSNDDLALVWDMVDRDNKGYLTKTEFYFALRGIGLIQHGFTNLRMETLESQPLTLSQLPRLETTVSITEEEVTQALKERIAKQHTDSDPAFHATISNPKKNGSHMVFEVTVHCELGLLGDKTDITTEKRYSQFDKLRTQLKTEMAGRAIPALPPKKVFAGKKDEDDDFVLERREGLEVFLNKILTDQHLRQSKCVLAFLQDQPIASSSSGSSISRTITTMMASSTKIDHKLEDFANGLAETQTALTECLKRLEHVIQARADRVSLVKAFVETSMPATLPLSKEELSGYSAQLENFFEQTFKVRMKGVADQLQTLLKEVKPLQEALLQVRVAAKQSETATAAANSASTATADSAREKSQQANARYNSAKQSMEEQILQFKALKRAHILAFVTALSESDRTFLHFESQWWDLVVQRTVFASLQTELKATVDLPLKLTCHRELSFFPPGVRSNEYVDEFLAVAFAIGQEAPKTLPIQKNDPVPSVVEPAPSFGVASYASPVTHANIPAYALSDGQAEPFEKLSLNRRENELVGEPDEMTIPPPTLVPETLHPEGSPWAYDNQ